MKKILLILLAPIYIAAHAQTTTQLGATEQQLNDIICDCITKQDLSQVSGKQQATKVLTDCMSQRTDLIMKIAEERKVEFTDEEGMRKIGLEIGKNLMSKNCSAALQLGIKMNEVPKDVSIGITDGVFKRIDVKGFNYIVITDANKSEKSFLWLTQFPESERFMQPATGLAGKKLSLKWREIEVYLPQAKGYYKVKEITEINFPK